MCAVHVLEKSISEKTFSGETEVGHDELAE